MIRAVLFDLGDTLLNFGQVDHLALFREGAEIAYRHLVEQGAAVGDFESYHRRQLRAIQWAYFLSKFSRRDCHATEVMARINRKMGLPTDPDALKHLAGLFYEPVRKLGEPEPDVHRVLTWIRDRPCKLALISNTIVPGVTLDEHLRREDLLDYFPHRFYSCDVGCRKPSPRIFEMALQPLGVDPAEAMYVGDTLNIDVKGANRVGMISVWKSPNGQRPGGRLQPDYVVKALTELPNVIEQHDRGN